MDENAINIGASGSDGGGELHRQAFTARGIDAFSSWTESNRAYSILQINLGSNPLSQLEVVSMLNVLSQSRALYAWNVDRTPKYNPKIYLSSALQSFASGWIHDLYTTPNMSSVTTQKQGIHKIFIK